MSQSERVVRSVTETQLVGDDEMLWEDSYGHTDFFDVFPAPDTFALGDITTIPTPNDAPFELDVIEEHTDSA